LTTGTLLLIYYLLNTQNLMKTIKKTNEIEKKKPENYIYTRQ